MNTEVYVFLGGIIIGLFAAFITIGWKFYELYTSHDWVCADCGRRMRGPTGPTGHLKETKTKGGTVGGDMD